MVQHLKSGTHIRIYICMCVCVCVCVCVYIHTYTYTHTYIYIGLFIMFYVITNICNKKTKRTYLNGIVHSHRKTEKSFFDNWICLMCPPRVTHTHTDTILKFLPHTRQHGCIDILHSCNDPCL